MNGRLLAWGAIILIAVLAIVSWKSIYAPAGEISGAGWTEPIKTTGMFGAVTNVGILEQNEAIMYEEDRIDDIFEFDYNTSGAELSYNGSYGGMKSGYDSFDNQTQTFTLENVGSTTIDVALSAEDFSSGADYIDVGAESEDFQVYIPGVGWRNIPDNSDSDIGGGKDGTELCIAKSLLVGGNLSGFDFKARGTQIANYTSYVRVTSYDSENSGACSGVGTYINPGSIG